MIIDIMRLKSGVDTEILIDTAYSFSEEELKDSGILKLDDVSIKGNIALNSADEYQLCLDITGTMVLPCSLTLKPVDYPFSIKIDNSLAELYEEMGKNEENIGNSIDILSIIWENILMEVPMKVTSSDLSDYKKSGDGWQVIDEVKPSTNPELEKLKDLL